MEFERHFEGAIQKMAVKVFDADRVAKFKVGRPSKKWA